jgi:hypothetical protein
MVSEKFLTRLMGRTEVEDTLERLDRLTKEETLMAVTRNLGVTHRVDDNVMAVKGVVHNIDVNVEQIKRSLHHGAIVGHQGIQLLRKWLSAPDPSINHNIASKTQHAGTTTWFTQSSTFRDWKKNGSLLWILGNRMLLPSFLSLTIDRFPDFAAGAGKSILW